MLRWQFLDSRKSLSKSHEALFIYLFCRNWQGASKTIWKHKELTNEILKRKTKFGGVGIPTPYSDYETHYKSMVIKTMEYLGKDKHMDQQNRKSSEINPYIYN